MQTKDLFSRPYPTFSLEVFPPKTKSSVETIYTTLSGLKGLPVDFISVTYGAGGSDTQKNKTCEIASLIKREYGIEPVAHLTCVSSTREELKQTLAQLKENGVENILALRGDIPEGMEPKHDFYHANELASFIKAHYPECNLLGACYPEVHAEAKSMDQDIQNLKHKVDAGVSHLITQLFFDNSHFYHFMEKLRGAGVDTPVEAGIMPLTTVSQVQRMVSMCGASVPNELSTLVNRYADSPEDLAKAGTEFALNQIYDLIRHGVQGIHLYTMNNVALAQTVTKAVLPAMGRSL